MSDRITLFVGSKEQLKAKLRTIPAILSGRVPDANGIARNFQLAVGMAALSQIQADFATKARGGTGKDGVTWPPLSRKTVAGRRPPPHKKRGERPRGLLTESQDKKWRGIFVRMWKWLAKAHYSDQQAKEIACRIAWSKLKAEGARTRINDLGDRKVETLRDWGIMLNSLSPAIGNGGGDVSAQQVFEQEAGLVRVGIKGTKAIHHHGNPQRGLPARRLWAEGEQTPAWWQPILRVASQAVQQLTGWLQRSA